MLNMMRVLALVASRQPAALGFTWNYLANMVMKDPHFDASTVTASDQCADHDQLAGRHRGLGRAWRGAGNPHRARRARQHSNRRRDQVSDLRRDRE